MNLVIVESPAKAKTINKYLGSNYKVLSSFGHVRDLPSKDGAVEPENDFAMHWEVDSGKKAMKEIASAMKGVDKLILATDPDREGEAISWHILEVLTEKKLIKKGMVVERVAFNAITKQAILQAMSEPRQIDAPLVDAYLARRALDYLVGFNLSPVLWRKLPGARSAGRVQSVCPAPHLRPRSRNRSLQNRRILDHRSSCFRPPKTKTFAPACKPSAAKLCSASTSRMQPPPTPLRPLSKARTSSSPRSTKKPSSATPTRRSPPRPCKWKPSSKLGFGAPKHTMQIAQRLYEGVDIGGETVRPHHLHANRRRHHRARRASRHPQA